jgi:L-seryl-tRNA(Ser) seleniumtransferase
MGTTGGTKAHPPSIDSIARELSRSVPLPHAVLVDCARRAVSEGPDDPAGRARVHAEDFRSSLVGDVINATGVLLHTNLGRAPLPHTSTGRASNLEFDLVPGARGSRHTATASLLRVLIGAEDAVVVNNNAAAVMLVLAALADGRGVAVSRGESVEIGGGFRIPDVMEQSGARLVDVGTTNKTRAEDYERAVGNSALDVAMVMRVHPSNFAVSGFTESTDVADLSEIGVPVVSDIGSGLLDNTCPWVKGGPGAVPPFLGREPAALQTLRDGADLVTFSGDKLLGGPQCGIIAGRAELVARCARHPLMRALRPGSHTLSLLQSVLVAFANRTACETVPFWRMLTVDTDTLEARARGIVTATGRGTVAPCESLIGAGSAPGSSVPSWSVVLEGDISHHLRRRNLPVIGRVIDDNTLLDLRTVDPVDDAQLEDAIRSLS